MHTLLPLLRHIFQSGTAFLLEVTAFALEYSAVVVKGSRPRQVCGQCQAASSVVIGTEMSVRLELPCKAFYCDEGSEVLVWDGTHCTAVFEVTWLNQAERGDTSASHNWCGWARGQDSAAI